MEVRPWNNSLSFDPRMEQIGHQIMLAFDHLGVKSLKSLLFVRLLMPFSLFSKPALKQQIVAVWYYSTRVQWECSFWELMDQFHGDFESWLKNRVKLRNQNRDPLVSHVRF